MARDGAIGFAVLKLAGKNVGLPCDVLREEFPRVVVTLQDGSPECEFKSGEQAVLIESKLGQTIARSGVIETVTGDLVAFAIESGSLYFGSSGPKLTECHLPAMYRARSEDGHFGGWRGAIITMHSPNQLHLQVEEGHVVPGETELMFNPIGNESGNATRMYGEEGGGMSASDVRSRRIRVKAFTRDVIPSDPGTVTLVVEIARTLYRAA